MIVVPLLLALLFQAAPPSGSLGGFVIRAGTNPPVAIVNARLELVRAGGAGGTVIARTDFAGHFAFSSLPPGSYRLRITKDGFIRQEYRQVGLDKPGPPVILNAGQLIDNIVFRMEPARTISGVIRDRETKARVPGVMVQALKRGFDARGNPALKLMASTVTDDRGIYRLIWLDPGEYFVSATRPPPFGTSTVVAYTPTYFPGFVEVDAAKPVRLESGRDTAGIDFEALGQQAMAVDGYVSSITQGPVATAVSMVPPEDLSGVPRYYGKSALPTGQYGIAGVAPGSYLVTATSGKETGTVRIRIKFNPSLTIRVDVRIGEGLTIPGRIFSDTPIDVKNARVHLAEMDPAMPEPALTAITATGQFTVAAVQPGSYTLQIEGLMNDQYLKNAVFGQVDALEQPMAVSNSASPELQVQIASDGGRITGTVYDRNNALFPNVEVTLVPTSVSRFRFDRYRTALTGDDGQFTIRGIAPGDYKLFAWEDLEPNAHLNVDFMRPYESLGTAVHIEPNANVTVALRAITN